MCGFVGYHAPEGSRAPARERVEAALGALAHRGPDDHGIYFSPDRTVCFAHRRLEVIDPAGGAQPMADPETGCVVAANAEIYNFRRLLAEFEEAGRAPRSRSDTEALLTGFALHGDEVVHRLRGMFAFAAYDPRDGRLLLARDRLGQKPLVHAETPGGVLLFASEIGALLALLGETPEPDEEALSIYLSFGYVPAPWTAYCGVRKLPAGHVLRSGAATPERYWRRPPPDPGPFDAPRATEEIRELIRDAVRSRLVSDVPLGAFLSGGLDSATVVASMAEAGPVRTFTVRNPDPAYDESELAAMVARRYGTDHTEIPIEAPDVEEIPELLGRFGEPFGDSSALAVALISRAAREHVTVALTGDGGDEAFGGYDRYAMLNRLGRVPAAGRILAPLLPGRAGRALALAGMEPWRRYYEFYESFNGGQRDGLLTPRVAERWGDAPARFLRRVFDSQSGEEIDRMLGTDAETWLPDDLNPKVDISSMAVALECRSPLQDHLLVSRCARVPARHHVRGGRKKALLREIASDLLPPEVLAAPKRGFASPVERWFRGDLRGFLESKLQSRALASLELVRPEGVERVIESLDRPRGQGHPRIQAFILLALAVWAEGLS